VSTRLIGLLLRLAPRRFRGRYASEMLAVHAERREERAGGNRRWWFGLREVVGVLRLVAKLRLDGGPGDEVKTTRGGGATMDAILNDFRFALRTLRRNPGFTLAAVVVLGLGIGANTAIFSAANAFLFRPLPFADEDGLALVYETNPEFGWTDAAAAPANALDWREQVEAFQDLALYSEWVSEVTHISEGEPELLGLNNVTGNFFDVLGVHAEVGRTFRWDETWEGKDDVVVLSHDLWVSHFGADPSVVGRMVEIGGGTVEVVGVMPDGFVFPDDRVDLWSPFGWPMDDRQAIWFRRAHWLRPVVRLAPGTTLEEADAQLQVVVGRLSQEYPETNRVMGAGLAPMRAFMIRDVRTPLLILVGAVGLLLVLACTNVANLVLVRGAERSREVALRAALGAGRRRVMTLLLAESVVLSILGGAVGLALGWMGVQAMKDMTRLGIQGATGVVLDHRVALFVLAAAAVSGTLFGFGPALRSSGAGSAEALKEGGRSGTPGLQRQRLVNALVVAEVGLALMLVIGAGLMVRSFARLRAVDPGFSTEGTIAVQFSVPGRYQSRDEVLDFQRRFAELLQGRPGIERVGRIGQLPLAGTSWSSQFQAEGWPPERVGFEIVHRRADAGYFDALDIPLLRGRMFAPDDAPDGPLVVVVNETFVREHFPGEDPIGQKIAYDRAAAANPDDSYWYEIIGIVGDQHQVSPGEPPRAEVFEYADQDWGRDPWFVMKTSVEPLSVVPAVRSVLAELDPLIPVARVRPLREVWRSSMARQQFILTLLTAFGIVALLLAAVGVYGVTAQAARTRTQEIGIRMALGARGSRVVAMMLRQGLTVVGMGLALGLGASLLATRALTTLLFNVDPADPGTITAVVLLLGGVATLACYLPARRATRVDPVTSLRSE